MGECYTVTRSTCSNDIGSRCRNTTTSVRDSIYNDRANFRMGFMNLAPTGLAILSGMSISAGEPIHLSVVCLFATILFSSMPKRFEVESDVYTLSLYVGVA